MTLRWRIVSVIALLVLLLCAVAGLAIRIAQQRGELYESLETVVEPARERAHDVSIALDEAEIGFRLYAVQDDPSHLRTAQGALQRASRALDDLEQLLEEDGELLAVVESAQAAVEPWHAVARSQLSGRPATDEQDFADRWSDDVGPVEDDVMELSSQLTERRAEILVDLQDSQRRFLSTVLGAAVVAVLVAVHFTWLLHRWISSPIETISAAVDRVAAGSLQTEIPRTGPGELGTLSTNVEHMRRRLVEQLDEANRARQGLEQQGPAVASLQAALVPSRRPLPGWLRAAAAFGPARGVLAGDCYDVLVLDAERVAVVVIDVSGHGPAAGVLALRAKEQLGAALRSGQAPGEALACVAATLGDTGEQFLTCLVVELRPDGDCRYASAGHPPALLVTADGTTQLAPTGPLLGPLSATWDTAGFTLPDDGSLMVYTDGLLEARDGTGEAFETARVGEVVRTHRALTPAELVSGLARSVATFTGGSFGDDITVVAVSRQPGERDRAEPSYLETFPTADLGAVQSADLSQPLEPSNER